MRQLTTWALALLLLVSYHCAQAQRTSFTINTHWQFIYADDASYAKPDAKTDDWENISLPHSWNTVNAFDDADGYDRGTGWYRHNLFIPKTETGRRMYLYFEGANQITTVFVNGQKAGEHIGGYAAFRIEITNQAKPGQNNSLAIKVDNSHNDDIAPLSADFTFFGGIYRDVYYESVPAVHFDMENYGSKGVFVSTPSVSAQEGKVNVKGKFANQSPKTAKVTIKTTIYDADQKAISTLATKEKIAPEATASFSLDVAVANPKLWSPSNPYLYSTETEITDTKTQQVLDKVQTPLGFRWFSLTDGGLLLNGQKIKLMGVNRHQDFERIGNALTDEYHYQDMQLLKNMGANFIRIAHYPQDPAILEACDQLGIMAWEEIPIVNYVTPSEAFTNNCLTMQKEMIRQHYNHPSVIMWGYMNEVMLRPPKGVSIDDLAAMVKPLAEKLEALTRKEDPNRLTTVGNHGDVERYAKAGLNDLCMLTGYNLYYGWYWSDMSRMPKFFDDFYAKYPEQHFFVSEFGAGADPRLHSYKPHRFDFSNEWQLNFHEQNYKHIISHPKVIGGTVWNLVDFGSEGRIDAVPHVNNKGLLTIDRKPKDAYYFYQAALTNKPMVHINTNFWTQRTEQADEGKNVATRPISVYTNNKTVTLMHNREVIGTKNVENFKATFDVPLQNGPNLLEALVAENSTWAKDATTINVNLLPANLGFGPVNELYINVGSNCHLVHPNNGVTYVADQDYKIGSFGIKNGRVLTTWEGFRIGTDKEIFNTELDPVYQTAADSLSHYKVDLPNGVYKITLMFCEVFSNKEKEKIAYNLGADKEDKNINVDRVFSVKINSKQVIENLDLTKTVGEFYPYERTFTVKINNGQGLNLNFEAQKGTALLNGLKIKRLY